MLNLEPKSVWKYFEEISKIPRCSKHEEKIGEYILSVAKENDLEAEKDEAGNVVIRKPAASGYEDIPITILQSHMDMVCEKNEDVEHDFSTDPISLKREGDWLTAEGTTLGADDGIGVATALALATDKNLKHGPLEMLFTVDEETGLTGASNLKPDFLKGKRLINLDSEEIDKIVIGCAGGGNSSIVLHVESGFGKGKMVKIAVTGLKGGHSGIDIDKGRANSIKILSRLLWKINREMGMRVCELKGGDKHNAIPREATATILVSEDVKKLLDEQFSHIKNEYKATEPQMKVEIEEVGNNKKMFTTKSSSSMINLIRALPHGVLAMSQEVPGLVETSTNLATVSIENDELKITMSSRSSIRSALDATRERIRVIAESFKADVEEEEAYPGWKPNLDSPILRVAKNAYKKLFNDEPEMKAIHAGLETGIIGEKFGDMDMISIGPEVEHPHSPDERVNIPSVKKFWIHLTAILEELAE